MDAIHLASGRIRELQHNTLYPGIEILLHSPQQSVQPSSLGSGDRYTVFSNGNQLRLYQICLVIDLDDRHPLWCQLRSQLLYNLHVCLTIRV